MFDWFFTFWNTVVVGSTEAALRFLFDLLATYGLGSWGLTIILFTMLVKLITLPLTAKSFASSRAMQDLQPQLKALQAQYKGDREKMMQAQMQLYKEAGVNPFAGCLPTLIQMPVWIALYSALFNLSANEESFSQPFLWIPTLAQQEPFPYIFIVLTVVTQWITQKMMTPPTSDPQQQMTNQIMQVMPIMFGVFAFSVPVGLVIYWVASNVFTMGQYYFMMPKKDAVNPVAETVGLVKRLLGGAPPAAPNDDPRARGAAEPASGRPARGRGAAPSPDPADGPAAGDVSDGGNRSQSTRRRRGRRR